ncbi:MAG: Cys-Xaa-Xaa-Xaa repeat radical SAM target protein [Bacteroidales bacterium]|nr:Cys-Xaa-Xaa-Xaa repeat radical SAM target protein [Bacteroidales bacterium]
MENGENKNLQGRREFFKEAARKALPILGAVALMSSPVTAKTFHVVSKDCSNSECTKSCVDVCKNTCNTMCHEGCKGCNGTCKGSCLDSCKDSNE